MGISFGNVLMIGVFGLGKMMLMKVVEDYLLVLDRLVVFVCFYVNVFGCDVERGCLGEVLLYVLLMVICCLVGV